MKTTTFRMDEEKLNRIDEMARHLNRWRSWVLNQAIDRFLDCEEWSVKDVKEGIEAAENGDFAPDDAVRATFQRWGTSAGY